MGAIVTQDKCTFMDCIHNNSQATCLISDTRVTQSGHMPAQFKSHTFTPTLKCYSFQARPGEVIQILVEEYQATILDALVPEAR